MRIAWVMVAVLGLGCSVQVTGAPCADDLQCPKQQHCAPEAACLDGARSEEMVAESCRQAVRAVAERVGECLGSGTEDVLKLLGPESVCASVEASVASGRQDFKPEEFGACVRNLRQTACGNLDFDKLSLGTMLDGCPAFAPQVSESGECANSADCQNGWCSATDKCPGVCHAFIPYSGACTNADRCQQGSTCSGSVCRRYVGLAGICSGGVPCDPNSNSYCLDGRCVERKTAGACTGNDECAARHACVKTQPAQGNNSPKECRPVKALNEPCEPGAGECATLSFCDAGTRTCISWPGPGERCGDPNGTGESALCLETRCDFFSSVCLPYVDVGGGCFTSLDCGPSRSCRGFRCVPIWCQ
jgi:hypothetical protein